MIFFHGCIYSKYDLNINEKSKSKKINMNVCVTKFEYRKKDAVSRTRDVRKIGVRQLLR